MAFKDLFVKEKNSKKEQVTPERIETPQVEYNSMDACICCGRYMAEGTGMVCPECQKKYGLDENKRH